MQDKLQTIHPNLQLKAKQANHNTKVIEEITQFAKQTKTAANRTSKPVAATKVKAAKFGKSRMQYHLLGNWGHYDVRFRVAGREIAREEGSTMTE